MTTHICDGGLCLVCDGCGEVQRDTDSIKSATRRESFRGWIWGDAPETPEDIFRAVTYCPRCASYIRTREDGSKYDIRAQDEEGSETEEEYDLSKDPLFKDLIGASLLSEDLPDRFIERMAEDYLRELAGMKRQVGQVMLLPVSAEARRETLAFVVMHVETMLLRTKNAIQAQERARAKVEE